MAHFWLGTWEVNPPILPTHCSAEPLVTLGAHLLAVEIIKEGSQFIVLFSAADQLGDPGSLAGRIGFANSAAGCSALRAGGFPVVDARIDYEVGLLQMHCPYFPETVGTMQYREELIALNGIHFEQAAGPGVLLAAEYTQFQEGPDPGHRATLLRRQNVRWQPARSRVVKIQAPTLYVRMSSARSPSLRPLEPGPLVLSTAWSGVAQWPAAPTVSPDRPAQVGRAEIYGEAAFDFQDMEVVGFRLDLRHIGGIDDRLAELIAPLNFQFDAAPVDNPVPELRYRVGTAVLQIEMLRYGGMRLQTALAPLESGDFAGQHELVVRVLVGKAIDGYGSLHDPAVFVPAIVVDNPWSKILGRDLQGFDKCMAEFCITQGTEDIPLRPDGRTAAGDAWPLGAVSCIKIVERTVNDTVSRAPTILELDFPPDQDGSWQTFRSAFADMVSPEPMVSQTRWRLSDFNNDRIGNAFATQAIRESLTEFRSVQVSPVDQRKLDKTRVSSLCSVRDLAVAWPSGGAQLVIHSVATAPRAWQMLCKLLDIQVGDSDSYSFQRYNWYRLKFSMGLKTDD